MSAILGVTGPIFALIALGYAVTRAGVFRAADLQALTRYVLVLALPALIFRAVTARDLANLIDPGYLGVYLGGSLATLAIGYWLGRRSGLNGSASTFQGMGMACANTGFMGYPILLIAMPAVADGALALNMISDNLVMIPTVLFLAERGRGGAAVLDTVGRVALNPIVLSLVAGLVVVLTPLAVPAPLIAAIDLIAQSSAAVSLLVIGGTLVGVPRSGVTGGVALVVAGKLLLHPLLVAAGFTALGLAGVTVDPAMVAAGVLMAAMPAMGVYPIFATHYGQGGLASVAMLAMTVASFLTLGGLLSLLGLVPA